MFLTDAHCHLQTPELKPHLESIWPELARLGIRRLVCNGMSESDWPEVARLAAEHPEVLPSFGLHPWQVEERTPAWFENLISYLDAHPSAGVGEIGLDKMVKNVGWDAQVQVFRQQLEIAAKRNLPASIHCVQAWGPLWEEIQQQNTPERGFLIHAYGGSVQMVPGFVGKGAYFSFSPWFLHEKKAARREVFRHIPINRILIETDAPALWPPPELNNYPLTNPASGETLNHPGNLIAAFEGLAETLGVPTPELAEILERNFQHWFLDEAKSKF